MTKLAIMASGGGTNFQRILTAIEQNELTETEVFCLIADRDCKALDRAMDAGIPAYLIPRKSENQWEEIQAILGESVDLIVLAGFLSILPPTFIATWRNKIINIHPSLLPKYGGPGMYGMHVHKAVLANHEKESGATVHYVTEGVDEGEIIIQKAIPIKPNETPEWLATKVNQVEYEILVKAIQIHQENPKDFDFEI